ncbi:protein white-like [Ptychodera flava]|uniref:protein white-like n=1 Tax=Ptychodera flava TaxID=63121 RepID=UPI00396A0CB2
MDEDGRFFIGARRRFQESGSDSDSDSQESSFVSFRFRAPRRSTIFQDQRLTLTWDGITVRTIPKRSRLPWKRNDTYDELGKEIVCRVSGFAKPGALLAILGPSGSGKSTLLDAITFRTKNGLEVDGNILTNGEPADDSITSAMAYVQQEDLFLSTLTVREHLQFQAMLRMDREITGKERLERVEEVIGELGLTDCASTRIGEAGTANGISGGERKRLSLAAEILTDPPILICDEPTTGLDKFMAEVVASKLSDLSTSGHTIICSIHQPSSEIFQHLDNILMLCEGRCAYMGPRDELVEYFSGIGYNCPETYNPADYFIEKLSTDPDIPDTDIQQTICNCFEQSNYYNKVQEVLRDQMFKGRTQRKSIMACHFNRYKNSWLTQFVALLWRCAIRTIRDRGLLKVRFYSALVMSLFIGLAYFQIPYSQSGVRSIQGMLAMMIYLVGMDSFWQTIRSIQPEAVLFFREHSSGMYRTDAYFLAKSLMEIPICLIVAILGGSISYWMTGLNPEIERFFTYLFLLFVVGLAASALGFTVSTACTTDAIALAVSVFIIMPVDIFTGFYINVETIPVYLRWFEYISYTRYGYEALSINQWFEYGDLACDVDSNKTENICLPDGDSVLEMYSFYPKHFPMDVTMLLILAVGFQLIAYLLLLGRTYLKLSHRKNM